ncbi:hypothetical protein LZC95_44270 [Pendulispora brunnea]|uniref:Uncharacterized protein n=1 Tax=Pendulispora brunnea TaxID=2905690 RepID=A0ABZ2K9F2_9BACT
MTGIRFRDAVLSGAVLLTGLAALAGCKKQVDFNSVDAGAAPVTAEPTTNAAAQPSATAEAPKDDSSGAGDPVAPLAPLTGGSEPTKKPASGGSGGSAKPKPTASASGGKTPTTPTGTATGGQPPAGNQPPECAQAARFCNHPAYNTDSAIKAMCEAKKAECTRKGGHI